MKRKTLKVPKKPVAEAPVAWPYMGLMHGVQLDWSTLDMSLISPNALAIGLSIEPRYAGQIGVHYSVAAHSMLCAAIYIMEEGDIFIPEIALALLMHDAHESFMKDIPTSLKCHLPEYQKLEGRVERALWESYGIAEIMEAHAATVKRYDLMALQTEREYFNFDPLGDWSHLGPSCKHAVCESYLRMDSALTAKHWLTNVLYFAEASGLHEFDGRAT